MFLKSCKAGLCSPDEPVTSSIPFVTDLRDAFRNAHDRVRKATELVARVQTKYFDEKSRQTKFHEGQLAPADLAAVQETLEIKDWPLENRGIS